MGIGSAPKFLIRKPSPAGQLFYWGISGQQMYEQPLRAAILVVVQTFLWDHVLAALCDYSQACLADCYG